MVEWADFSVVVTIRVTIRYLAMLSTQEDILPTKYSKDTNSLSEEEDAPEDEHVAMSTAESEYIEMAKIILATSRHRPRSNTPTRQRADNPHLEISYEETQTQNTEHEPDERNSNIPEEPKSNTEQSITCFFNMGHTNISPKKWRQHLRKCRESE